MIVRIKAEDFARALKCIIPHASTDVTRSHLNAILLTSEGGYLTMVATDGHRLAHWRFTVSAFRFPVSDGLSFLLSLADAKTLLKSLPKKGDQWVDIDTKAGSFTVANQAFQFKAVDAQFPPYQQVIPSAESLTTHPGEQYVPWLSINADYLADIAKSFANATTNKLAVMYIVSSHARPSIAELEQQCLDPIVFRGATTELTIICMPVRADTPSYLSFPSVPVADAAE
jgi:hypothetical protein